MKICPRCNLRYQSDSTHCFVDREPLEEAPDPFLGKVIAGKYLIEGIVGSGGMATVYRAVQNVPHRVVAIKLFRRELASDPRLRERFRREASSTRRLAHPNIIEILDEGELEDDTPYMVMELLLGETLEAILKRTPGPMHLGRAIDLNLQAVSALGRAHDFQVIHRDLKPDNLFVCPQDDGTELVKVLDFGIARSMHDTRLTGTGEIFGTPQYMAPERITSIDAGPPADLYAVGCILFRCVTGRLPFVAQDVTGYLIQHLKEPAPSARSLNPEVPPELDQLVLQCLEKDPTRRPVSARRIAKVLGDLAASHPRPARVSGAFLARSQPSTLESAPPGRNVRFSPASLERWERRVQLFSEMLSRVSQAGSGDLTPRLERVQATHAAMADLHGQWLREQEKGDAITTQAREAQGRFGRAMDAIGQDLTRAREELREAQDLTAQHEAHAQGLAELFIALHADLATTGPEPTPQLLDRYRDAVAALERSLGAADDLLRAQTYAASKETEVQDLDFQIEALRKQLERVSQAADDELAELQKRLERAGEGLAEMEEAMIHDAGELAGALRGHRELRDLFAQLETDAA
jgi:serine/threonine-protein kinase